MGIIAERRAQAILESFCRNCEERDTCAGNNEDCIIAAEDIAKEENEC